MQHAAFNVHLIELQPAGLGHAESVPEHQKQKAAVAGFVPAALRRVDQLLNLAPGQMQTLALCHADIIVPPAPAGIRGPLACALVFLDFMVFPVLSRVRPSRAARNPYKPGTTIFNFRQNSPFCRELAAVGRDRRGWRVILR